MEYLQGNVDFALDYFSKRIPAIKMTKPEATYLIWLDCRSLSLSAEGLIEFFEKEAKLGVADGAMFGVEGMGFVRMNIACRRKTMEEALGRLERAVNKRLQRKVERKV